MEVLLGLLLSLIAIFLVLLVLVQRGRGGGLAGALGGMGGQSAFGAKAGDVFTRVTMGTAAVWIILCVASLKLMGGGRDPLSEELGGAASPSEGPVISQPIDRPGAAGPAEESAEAAAEQSEQAADPVGPPAGAAPGDAGIAEPQAAESPAAEGGGSGN
jgi:preprotein translocase subunit SecG